MDRVSWNWILNGLDEALEFCRRLRLGERFEGGRFGKYRVWVAELVSALKTGGQEGARAAFNEHPARSSTALTESFELADILPFARSLAPEIIKRSLMRILLGPARPADETTNTNEARNILFELTMASKLWRAGLVPELVEPDIRCEVDGRAVYVACKRPFAGTGSRQAYTDALAQIRTGLTGPPASARGVVALSVTRLLNSGGRIFEFTAQAAREDRLGKLLEHLTEEVSAGWDEPGHGTIGLLWHVVTPALDTRRALARLSVMDQLNVQRKSPVGSADALLFTKLVDGIERGADAENRS